jgi:hypothetical protein
LIAVPRYFCGQDLGESTYKRERRPVSEENGPPWIHPAPHERMGDCVQGIQTTRKENLLAVYLKAVGHRENSRY